VEIGKKDHLIAQERTDAELAASLQEQLRDVEIGKKDHLIVQERTDAELAASLQKQLPVEAEGVASSPWLSGLGSSLVNSSPATNFLIFLMVQVIFIFVITAQFHTCGQPSARRTRSQSVVSVDNHQAPRPSAFDTLRRLLKGVSSPACHRQSASRLLRVDVSRPLLARTAPPRALLTEAAPGFSVGIPVVMIRVKDEAALLTAGNSSCLRPKAQAGPPLFFVIILMVEVIIIFVIILMGVLLCHFRGFGDFKVEEAPSRNFRGTSDSSDNPVNVQAAIAPPWREARRALRRRVQVGDSFLCTSS
jgi:hypothetical protein